MPPGKTADMGFNENFIKLQLKYYGLIDSDTGKPFALHKEFSGQIDSKYLSMALPKEFLVKFETERKASKADWTTALDDLDKAGFVKKDKLGDDYKEWLKDEDFWGIEGFKKEDSETIEG